MRLADLGCTLVVHSRLLLLSAGLSGYKDDPKPVEKSIEMLGKMLVSETANTSSMGKNRSAMAGGTGGAMSRPAAPLASFSVLAGLSLFQRGRVAAAM